MPYPQDLAYARRQLTKDDFGTERGYMPWLPIQKTHSGQYAGEVDWAVPQMLRDAGVGLIDLLAGTRTGQVTPEATGLLFDMAGGGAATAPLRAAGRAGIFGGRLAKTADLDALEQAQNMLKEGANRYEIWDETGWFQGKDGKWRFEIDDSQSQFDSAGFVKKQKEEHDARLGVTEDASILRHRAEKEGISIEDAAQQLADQFKRPIAPESITMAKTNDAASLKAQTEAMYAHKPGQGPAEVGNVVNHPELFEAYPDLTGRPYHRVGIELGLGTRGAYSPPTDEFYISKFYSSGPQERQTGLHEMQHAVQKREGFASGGSPANVMDMPGVMDIAHRMIGDIKRNAEATLKAITGQAEQWAVRENKIAGGKGIYHNYEDAVKAFIKQAPPEIRDRFHRSLDALRRVNQPDAVAQMAPYLYERLAGEVEARNVAYRRNMTPEERRIRPPWTTQDYSDEQMIVTSKGGASLMKDLAGKGDKLPMDEASRMARAREMGFDTDAYHVTGADFDAFKPNVYRGASYFGATPQGAVKGAQAGAADGTGSRGPLRTIPVKLKSEEIYGLALTPKEKEFWQSLPDRVSGDEMDAALLKGKPENLGSWYRIYEERVKPDGTFEYVKRPIPKVTLEEARRTGLDVYGRQFPHWNPGTEKPFGKKVAEEGMSGYVQIDEAGTTVGVVDPTKIRSRFAAFDPAKKDSSNLLAVHVGTGLGPASLIDALRDDKRDRIRRRKGDRLN